MLNFDANPKRKSKLSGVNKKSAAISASAAADNTSRKLGALQPPGDQRASRQPGVSRQNLSSDSLTLIENSHLQEKCRSCSGYEEKIPAKTSDSHFFEDARKEKLHILLQMCDEFLKTPGFDEKGIRELHLDSPCDALKLADHVFERFKYVIADFVMRHEYNHDNDLSVQVTLWLEQQSRPASFSPLKDFIRQYLKNPCQS